MFQPLALAMLCACIARGAGPSYTDTSIVNAVGFTPGPFAPGSVIAIFGTGLARSEQKLVPDDFGSGKLPLVMNSVHVYVENQPMPILYVSEGQVNFIM